MADLLGIGVSGLSAFQNAINLVGHNISNANNENYSRRTVHFSERTDGLFGAGVNISYPERIFNELALLELRNGTSAYYKAETFLLKASEIENILANDSLSVTTGLDQLFSSLQNINGDPSSIQSRSLFIDQSEQLVNRFHLLKDGLVAQHESINAQLSAVAQSVSTIAESIAEINKQIVSNASINQPELQDARDGLLRQLAKHVAFNSVEMDDGSINIYLGSGNPLVFGGQSAQLQTKLNSMDPQKYDIYMVNGATEANITDQLEGGELGGVLSYRSNMLDDSLLSLNRLALAIADGFNQQNKMGVDLQGNLGGDLFNAINSTELAQKRVIADANNVGSANLDVMIDDISTLINSDYRLEFSSATDYTLTRLSDKVAVSGGSLGALPQQISLDGFTLNLNSGSFSTGDRFLVSPSRDAAQTLNVIVSDPSLIAAASPILTSQSLQNTGTAQITNSAVSDISNASFTTPGQLTPPLRIEFLSTTSYQVVNATTSAVIEGPITYNPAAQNAVFPTPGSYDPGYRITLSGAANVGDNFTMNYNANGVSDNRNGLLLSDLFNTKILDNGTASFTEDYQQFVGSLAVQTRSAKISYDTSEIVLDRVQQQRDSISGVNVEEEAVNLMRFEQLLQANAQVIIAGKNVLDTIISLLGR